MLMFQEKQRGRPLETGEIVGEAMGGVEGGAGEGVPNSILH